MNVIIGVNIRQGTQFIINIRQETQFLRPQARVDAISSTICPLCQVLHISVLTNSNMWERVNLTVLTFTCF